MSARVSLADPRPADVQCKRQYRATELEDYAHLGLEFKVGKVKSYRELDADLKDRR